MLYYQSIRQTLVAVVFGLFFSQTFAYTIPRVPHGGRFPTVDFTVERALEKLALGLLQGNVLSKSGKSNFSEVPINNFKTSYYTDLLIGSDEQKVSVVVDTGSSDLWVLGPNASCHGQCNKFGTYNPSTSITSKNLNETFMITYIDYTSTEGHYYSDDVSFASNKNLELEGLQFGVADETSASSGILGLGFPALEATNKTYDNLPALLKKQGVIDKSAYSLYLNKANANKGTLIFGGVDTEKYSGSLVPIKMSGDGTRASLNLNSISQTESSVPIKSAVRTNGTLHSNTTVHLNQSFILDSGSTLSYVPSAAFSQLGKIVGGKFNGDGWEISCNQSSKDFFTFAFEEGVEINVPHNDLVYKTDHGECIFGILPNDELAILGDNFLRSAYVVYNLDNKTISMAQTEFSNELNLIAI